MDFDQIKKHTQLYRSDDNFIKKLIQEHTGVETYAQAIHFLINAYQEQQNSNEMKHLLEKLQSKLINMSIEQSTMSEYISDYLYVELYHDNATHINHGTDTDGYRNAKKLAMERLKNNQKEMTHRKNHIESEENKANRITSRKKYSWEN